MTAITYCENGCQRRDGDEWHPVQTEPPSLLCPRCETRLEEWLRKIPDTYALLPLFIEHGSVDRNPDTVATKRTDAPAPMRLDIIDLLDTRRGRKWNGTQPTEDRRGVVGILAANVDRLVEERPLTTTPPADVAGCCNLLHRHRLWLAEQDWIADLYDDLRTINRTLSDAVGDYRAKPVGRCPALDEQGDECQGPIYATLTGAHCPRCGEHWQGDHLRILGSAMTA